MRRFSRRKLFEDNQKLNQPFRPPRRLNREPNVSRTKTKDIPITETITKLFSSTTVDFRKKAKKLAHIILNYWNIKFEGISLELTFNFPGSNSGYFKETSGVIINGPNRLEKLIKFFEDILRKLIDNYSGYEADFNFPIINSIKITYYNLGALRDMNNRYVFGGDMIDIKRYLKFCFFSKNKAQNFYWTELKQFLKAINYGLWIPTGQSTCLKQCLYMVNHLKDIPEDELFLTPKSTFQKKINAACKSYTSTFFDKIKYSIDENGKKIRKVEKQKDRNKMNGLESVGAWISAINKKIKENPKRFPDKTGMEVFDFDIDKGRLESSWGFVYEYDELLTSYKLASVSNRSMFDSKIIILIVLNHACLLIPNKYKEWKNQMKKEFMDIDELSLIPKFKGLIFNADYLLLTFDLETMIENNMQEPFLVGFYFDDFKLRYGGMQDYQRFTGKGYCVTKFLQFLKRFILKPILRNYTKPINVYIFAHNGGKFDFYLIIHELLNNGWIIEKTVTKTNRFYSIKVWPSDLELKKEGRVINVEFRDSYTLVPFSLDMACQAFNVDTKKLHIDIDWNKINEQNQNEYIEGLSEYLYNDCVSLKQILNTFNKLLYEKVTFCSNNFQFYSLPSISKKAFLMNFYDKDTNGRKLIYELPDFIYNFVKQSYYGGRTQARYKKEVNAPIYAYDFKSLYPAMMQKDLPIGKPRYVQFNSYTKDINDFFGFYQVSLKLKNEYLDSHFPTIPIRKADGLYFPKINETTTIIIFSEELKLVKQYYEIDYIDGIEFDRYPIYKDYIKFLYRLKEYAEKENNLALRTLMKILLNSGYGAWGLKHEAHPTISIEKHLNGQQSFYLDQQ